MALVGLRVAVTWVPLVAVGSLPSECAMLCTAAAKAPSKATGNKPATPVAKVASWALKGPKWVVVLEGEARRGEGLESTPGLTA
jgi:hypothetical protein